MATSLKKLFGCHRRKILYQLDSNTNMGLALFSHKGKNSMKVYAEQQKPFFSAIVYDFVLSNVIKTSQTNAAHPSA